MPLPIPRIPTNKSGLTYSWGLGSSFAALERTKIRMCLSHWIDGQSWEETGIIELHEHHFREVAPSGHGSSRGELLDRYKRLDELRDLARKFGPAALDRGSPSSSKNPGGILFHLGPSNWEQEVAKRQSLDADVWNKTSPVETGHKGLSKEWRDLGVQPWFGGSCCHRLAIGLSLQFNWVPRVLSAVHPHVRHVVSKLVKISR
jgi:hypothetical protein